MRSSRKIIYFGMIALAVAFLGFVIPAFYRARTTRSSNACINNLRQIDGTKQQWALENHITNGYPTMSDLQPYMGRIPVCPEGGVYILGRVGQPPTCSIGGLDHSLN